MKSAHLKSLERRVPAERADGNESLTGAGRQPHRLHQAEVEHAQRETAHHISEVVFSQQHPRHAHQEGPEHQQDAERDGQDQVRQEEFRNHSCSAGVSRGERVDVHGDRVQKAWSHFPGSSAFDQSLESSYGHDIQEKSCHKNRTKKKKKKIRLGSRRVVINDLRINNRILYYESNVLKISMEIFQCVSIIYSVRNDAMCCSDPGGRQNKLSINSVIHCV